MNPVQTLLMLSDGEIENYVLEVRRVRDVFRNTDDEAVRLAVDQGLVPDDATLVEEILRRLAAQTRTTTVRIMRVAAPSSRSWPVDYDSNEGYHWRVQRDLLRDRLRRTDSEIRSLHVSTDEVLRDLGCPGSDTPFDVRGLVIGHVQSGKTQHFSALAAKALDAGYRIVVVLSGLHNSLRNQTQRRLMRDLGYQEFPGVGRSEDPANWISWQTELDYGDNESGDFNKWGGSEVLGQGGKFVAVVKKNPNRLERLNSWMAGSIPDGVPLLVIDDEADQASVDTSAIDHGLEDDPGGETRPSRINGLIRNLLTHAANSTYVGYTATPFANVLTDPDAWAEPEGASLFPKDFIDLLPEPPSPPEGKYVGTGFLFGDRSYDVLRPVSDVEAGSVNEEYGAETELTNAIRDYFLASAALMNRSSGNGSPPRTMLVHTGWTREDHASLVSKVERLVTSLKGGWRRKDDETMTWFRDRWDRDFRRLFEARFPEGIFPDYGEIGPLLEEEILGFLTDSDILLLNSDSDDELNFDENPSLRAILIGGNKLSRGITIEGLLVSYYVRPTGAGDTLLQMGRWFGYRGDFVDLTRLYTTPELYRDFKTLNQIECELREEIAARSQKPGYTPFDLPPILSLHPGMQFTAANKMRNATVVHLSWAGQEARTLRLPFDDRERLGANLDATKDFVTALGMPGTASNLILPEELPCWQADPTPVIEFLDRFDTDQSDFPGRQITEYIKRQNQHGELTTWHVVLFGLGERDQDLGDLDLGLPDGRMVNAIKRTRQTRDRGSLGALWDSAHYPWALTPEQKEKAGAYYEATRPHIGLHFAYRQFRPAEESLMVLYPISRFSRPAPGAVAADTQLPIYSNSSDLDSAPDVIGVAISFPMSNSAASRDVLTVANRGRQ